MATWYRYTTVCDGGTPLECETTTIDPQITSVTASGSSSLVASAARADGDDRPFGVAWVGDHGTALVRDGATLSAVDTVTWAVKWSATTDGEPIAALLGGCRARVLGGPDMHREADADSGL
ncbi:MAG: hypothetical protein AB7N65_28075 [Vicinamibacterales bacterium]